MFPGGGTQICTHGASPSPLILGLKSRWDGRRRLLLDSSGRPTCYILSELRIVVNYAKSRRLMKPLYETVLDGRRNMHVCGLCLNLWKRRPISGVCGANPAGCSATHPQMSVITVLGHPVFRFLPWVEVFDLPWPNSQSSFNNSIHGQTCLTSLITLISTSSYSSGKDVFLHPQ
jgi:hypothetical protein